MPAMTFFVKILSFRTINVSATQSSLIRAQAIQGEGTRELAMDLVFSGVLSQINLSIISLAAALQVATGRCLLSVESTDP